MSRAIDQVIRELIKQLEVICDTFEVADPLDNYRFVRIFDVWYDKTMGLLDQVYENE